MNNSLVSIIIPVYNAEKFIYATINSVINQTYNNLEIIIVNDGSTDGSEAVINSFSDTRIRYIVTEKGGQCKASNTGLLHATGELIKFLDHDDVMNKEHIELQVKRIGNRTNAVCSCEWGRFFDDNPGSAQFVPETVWKDLKPIDWLKLSLQQEYDMMGAWLWLIPRNVIEKTGTMNEQLTLGNDFEFSIRLLLNVDEVLFTPNAKLYYRTGGKTLSVIRSKSAYESVYLSTQIACSYLLRAEDSKLMRQLCANRYQNWIHQFYPLYPDLYLKMQREIEALGGANIKANGGRIFKFLSALLGWKIAKYIQRFFYRIGYR